MIGRDGEESDGRAGQECARSVLVTGGNGEIGVSIARAFVGGTGTQVFLGVRENRSAAEALAVEYPGRCRLVELDVTSPAAWKSAIEAVAEASGGRCDVLVNNAGFHDDALLATMDDGAWQRVIDANLTGVFFGCRAVVRMMMAQRWGRIVNIASLSALLAPAGQANYAAAKAGIIALSQSLSKEVARAGITVNTVCPGYIETAALADLKDDRRKAIRAQVPMRRLGRPEEVAAAVRFFASEDAAYITGATLKIDGGIF